MSDLATYYQKFEHVHPPQSETPEENIERVWHLLAGATIGFSILYLHWRWTESLNADFLTFSVLVASAETLVVCSTILFYFDIWSDPVEPTPRAARDDLRAKPAKVDVFITTFDEGVDVLSETISDAKKIEAPQSTIVEIFVLDDGQQEGVADFCRDTDVNYISRSGNVGYKAGNLKNALLQTNGDFVLILDADTRAFQSILTNTLPYFNDERVAWVQTPHWFYDIPFSAPDFRSANASRNILQSLPRSWDDMRALLQVKRDPFLSQSELFFDVIQRRRDRNAASFCCGAGSIHRRSAILENALLKKVENISSATNQYNGNVRAETVNQRLSHLFDLQPYAFHVSEDILTSIQLHTRGWTSKYHRHVEAKMLSPWSLNAWAMQKWKYSGGTFDIFCNSNPLFDQRVPLKVRAHYLSTFVSYLSILWISILLVAPILGLLFGISPVSAYSIDFMVAVLPALILNEATMYLACRRYDTYVGRVTSIATIPIQCLAAIQVLFGRRIKFPATPKAPGSRPDLFAFFVCLCVMAALFAVCAVGAWSTINHLEGFSFSMLFMNLFWIFFLVLIVGRVALMAIWSPELALERITRIENNLSKPD